MTDFERLNIQLHPNYGDILVFNTVKIALLQGFWAWLRAQPSVRFSAVVIVLRLGAEEGLPGAIAPKTSRLLYRSVLNKLHIRLGARLLLASDTRLIAEEFETLTGRPVAAIPLPFVVPEATPPRVAEPGAAHLVFLTAPERKRGFHLLPDALSTALARCPGLTVSVRIAGPRKSCAPLVERMRAMAPRVHLVEDWLDDADFYALLASADGVLLPYDPGVFAKRSSQILAQAASLGRPVIVMAGSFLDVECRSNGVVGISADAFTAEALAEAMIRFVNERDRLVEAAWAACPAQRARHSAAAFVDRVLVFADEADAAADRSERARPVQAGELGANLN